MVLRDHVIAVLNHLVEQSRKAPTIVEPNVFTLLEEDKKEGYLLETDIVSIESSPSFSKRRSRMFRALRHDVEPLRDLFQKVTSIAGRPASELYVSLNEITTLKGFFVSTTCCATRVHQLFRSLGLRHLCVCDQGGVAVGIVTRHELQASFERDLF